jgi:hypothetical protein
MKHMTEQELDCLVGEVINRAQVDENFRAKAVADGNAALTPVSKKQLPPGTKIEFVDNRPAKIVVLPKPVLYEDQLEAVAGGDDGGPESGPENAAQAPGSGRLTARRLPATGPPAPLRWCGGEGHIMVRQRTGGDPW